MTKILVVCPLSECIMWNAFNGTSVLHVNCTIGATIFSNSAYNKWIIVIIAAGSLSANKAIDQIICPRQLTTEKGWIVPDTFAKKDNENGLFQTLLLRRTIKK